MKLLYKILSGLVVVLLLSADAAGQSVDTSLVLIEEVLVTGMRETEEDRTSLNLKAITKTSLDKEGSFNLSDALASEPGVTQLSTGPGISKPVIRGLYGNRVLVLVSSLKFDNQQWQDEHGMGLSGMGVGRVELIKGPASVLYGSDVLAGVINVIEGVPKPGERSIELHERFYSNTLGNAISLTWQQQKQNHYTRILVGYENHGDYSDGNNNRVLNARFNGIYTKLGAGFKKGNWKADINYLFSLNQYGFILPDLGSFFQPDARWSRSMKGPHHIVMLNLLGWENRIKLKNSVLKLNIGFQSNQRKEDEGGGSISLNMHLLSVPYSLHWIRPLNAHSELIVSNIGSFENNTNYGGRVLVPDANMLEEGGALFYRLSYNKVVFEIGGGAGLKYINTLPTGILNTKPDSEILPFNITNISANGMAGVSYLPNKHWVLKLNFSSGHRAPNLAELSSNGLHEGTYQYEIGDPDLENERSINSELGIGFRSNWLDVDLSAYANRFFSYIYLGPTSEEYFGFQIYRYYQDKALIAGGEVEIKLHPAPVKGLEWTQCFSMYSGRLHNNEPLPFTPAHQWKHDLRYTFNINEKVKELYAYLEANYVLARNDVAEGETSTPDYLLFGAGFGGTFQLVKQTINIYLTGENLFNKTYYSHLSRLKAYGINNMGRNFVLTIKVPINY